MTDTILWIEPSVDFLLLMLIGIACTEEVKTGNLGTLAFFLFVIVVLIA